MRGKAEMVPSRDGVATTPGSVHLPIEAGTESATASPVARDSMDTVRDRMVLLPAREDGMAADRAATRYIAVEGPIGVGKTALARRLASEFGAKLILEQVEDNPFL